jgi:hypothetical protein
MKLQIGGGAFSSGSSAREPRHVRRRATEEQLDEPNYRLMSLWREFTTRGISQAGTRAACASRPTSRLNQPQASRAKKVPAQIAR